MPPPPGEPDAGVPPTGSADAAGGPAIVVAEGNGTEVGGVIKWTGGKGTIRIDVLQSGGEREGAVLHAANFPQPGEWRVAVNKDQGEISLQAFVDYNGDGPSPDEPSILRKGVTVRAEGNLDLDFDLDAAVADIGKAPRPQDGPPAPAAAPAPAAEGEAAEAAEEEPAAPAKAKAKAKSSSKSKSKSSSKAKAKSEG
jgi:nucleoid-associated protein YgaU